MLLNSNDISVEGEQLLDMGLYTCDVDTDNNRRRRARLGLDALHVQYLWPATSIGSMHASAG